VAVDFRVVQSPDIQLESALDLRDWQSGPPGAVIHHGRSMAVEVAPGQFHESFIRRQRRRRRNPHVKQRICVLTPLRRSATHERVELRAKHDVAECWSITNVDTCGAQRTAELRARQVFSTFERAYDRRRTALKECVIWIDGAA